MLALIPPVESVMQRGSCKKESPPHKLKERMTLLKACLKGSDLD